MNDEFEYLIITGSDSILENRDDIEIKNEESTVFNNYIKISKNILTGHFSTKVSVGGKTLFEEYPDLQVINGTEYFSIESGDYFVKTDYYNDGTIYFKDSTLNGLVAVYESKEIDSGSMAFQGSTGLGVVEDVTIPEITGKLNQDPPSDINDFFNRWDFFFDGTKVYEHNYDLFDSKTGKAFAYKKNEDLFEITGYNINIYDLGFLPKQFVLYVNGLEKSLNSTLEIYKGVSTIETGVYSSIEVEESKTNNFYL